MFLHPGGTSWTYGHGSVLDSDDQDYMCNDRWFHVICSSDLSCTRCHTRAYFHFGWDLRIFTEVTCATIDDFMSFCSSDLSCTWCHTRAYFRFGQDFADFHGGHMCDDRWFHVICYSDLSCTWCHTGAYFRFGWDLRIFTEVTCLTIDDFMSFVLRTCRAPDAILGHIFCFRCDLWIFTYVAWSIIDDFMSPISDLSYVRCHTGAYYRSRWDSQILDGVISGAWIPPSPFQWSTC